MGRTTAFLLLATSLLALGACGEDDESPAKGGGDGDVQEVRYVVPNPTFNLGHTPWPVAEKKGFFAEAGVKVKYQFTSGTPPAIQALSAGAADMAMIDTQALDTAIAQGVENVSAACTIIATNIYSVVVREDSDILRPEDLNGKTIAIPAIGSGSYVSAVAVVREAGLDPEDDVKFVPIEAPEAQLTALKDGRIDAIGTFDAGVGSFKGQGEKLRAFQPEVLSYQWTFLGVSHDFLEKHRDAVIGMCQGALRGAAFTAACPKAALDIYREAGHETPPEDEAALTIIQERAGPGFKPPEGGDGNWGWVPVDQMDALARTYVDLQVFERFVPVQKFYSNALNSEMQFDVEETESLARADGGC